MLSCDNNHIFCFGLGYVGTALCEALFQNGWTISGTVRTEDKRAAFEAKGFEVFCDQTDLHEAILKALSRASHILVTVPPSAGGDPIFNAYHSALSSLKSVRWLGYLSSSIVYGDVQGAWVDEDTPVKPNNQRGERRVKAETNWLASGLACHIFRISGIYGPGRNALVKVKSGTAKPVIKENHVFCRIHIDDIVAALMASMYCPNSGSIYNFADNEPAPTIDIIRCAAQLLNITPPEAMTIDKASLSTMALSFYDGCRRLKNDKIKNELGVTLKYPTYREGLKALVKDF